MDSLFLSKRFSDEAKTKRDIFDEFLGLHKTDAIYFKHSIYLYIMYV